MLRISQLIIQNFGPYCGRHSLPISEDDGVTIIWGDNGYGKTPKILNSLKKRGIKIGVAINPKTSIEGLYDILFPKAKPI